MSEIIMQTRCIGCKREQYAVAVFDISHGEHPCVWCGLVPPVFHDEKTYHEALSSNNNEWAKGLAAKPIKGEKPSNPTNNHKEEVR